MKATDYEYDKFHDDFMTMLIITVMIMVRCGYNGDKNKSRVILTMVI